MTFMRKVFLYLFTEENIIGDRCEQNSYDRRYNTHIKQVQIDLSLHFILPYPAYSRHSGLS